MNFISFYDTFTILPEMYLFFSICMMLLSGVVISNNSNKGYPLFNQSCLLLSCQILIFGNLLCLFSPLFTMSTWNYLLISNFYTYKLKIIILAISLGWTILSFFYNQQEKLVSFEYWILSILSILSILFICQAYDLLSMYLAIEFQSLTFYILTSYKRTSEFSTEAGLKYFVLGAFSSSFLLFGSSLLYSLTGITNFSDFEKFTLGFYNTNLFVTNGVLTGLIFILVALLFKVGSAPFHMWSPDVYEGAPTSTTAFLVVLPKISLILLIMRLFINVFQDYFIIFEKLILASALISLGVGTLGALSQRKWKRFIAYSSINHIGFVLLTLVTGNNFSVFSVLFYLVIYIFTMLNIFTWVTSYRVKKYLNNCQIRYLSDLCSLNYINPVLSITLIGVLFSMAGIPPLAGFFSKMFILLNILRNEIYGGAILAIVLSCLSCFYYIRLIKLIYFSATERLIMLYPINKVNSLMLGLTFFILCIIFLDLELITLTLENLTGHI